MLVVCACDWDRGGALAFALLCVLAGTDQYLTPIPLSTYVNNTDIHPSTPSQVVSVAEAFGGAHLSLHARVGMATDAGQPPFCWADHPGADP